MNKLFYLKLAYLNIKTNSKHYIPYIITSICTVVMYYVMYSLSINEGLNGVKGSTSLKIILNLGSWVIAIFSAIFLFYTNSFLIKKRKKELGLFNVLGLGKKHISIVLFFEFMITTIFSIVIGLVLGIVLDKLMFIILLKLLQFEVPYGFAISLHSISNTIILFTSIFFVTLVFNLFRLKVSNPIELLKGSQVGEREPKSKWIISIIGLASLIFGYYLALSVKTPLAALNTFFIAVIFVMIGTYSLFTTGSIILLKVLKKNKGFYYKINNFITVSGMMYRMKQNAIGLANICILSSAVIVTLSTTFSLFVGIEDGLRSRYPYDISINTYIEELNDVNNVKDIVNTTIKENNIDTLNYVDYTFTTYVVKYDKGVLELSNNIDSAILHVISINDYNKIHGTNISLKDDEILLYNPVKKLNLNNVTILGKSYKIKEQVSKLDFKFGDLADIVDTYFIFSNDLYLLGKDTSLTNNINFDVDKTDDEIKDYIKIFYSKLDATDYGYSVDSIVVNRDEFLSVYGGLYFIGLFLGTLFLMGTVLIIYYKQISEGYDDKNRFEIMQKVGMSQSVIRKTIKNQILLVFFLPLGFTILHIVVAFPIISKLLAIFNLTNINLFMLCTVATIIIFSLIYWLVYSLTARVYYKIVR